MALNLRYIVFGPGFLPTFVPLLQLPNLFINADAILLARSHLHLAGELRIVFTDLTVHHVALDVDRWKVDILVV